MSNTPKGKSYSQVMNEWAAQRSFVNRLRSRIIHPPYDAPWYGKLYGYAWRIAVVLIVLFGLSYIGLKQRIRSAGFRSMLAEEISKRYDATNVTCGFTRTPLFDEGCMIQALGADGTERSFFRRLDAHEMSFNLGWQFLRTDWKLENLVINRLNLKLRSGSVANPLPADSSKSKEALEPSMPIPERVVVPEFKTSQLAKPFTRQQLAGFGLNPDFSELEIRSYDVRDLHLTWGYSTTTTGQIEDANTSLYPHPKGGWEFLSTSGKLTQNWISNLNIKRLEAQISDDKITLTNAAFTHGSIGRMVMRGEMTLGDLPELNLEVAAEGIDLKSVTPAPFNKYFDATAKFSGRITGTVNRASGVKTQFLVTLMPPEAKKITGNVRPLSASEPAENFKPNIAYFANNIPLFRSLYVASGEDRLVQLALTEGSFELESGGGVVRIKNIDLRSHDYVRIRGEITSTEELEMPNNQTLLTDLEVKPKITYRADGNLFIGLHPDTVKAMPEMVRSRYFLKEEAGFWWMQAKFNAEDGNNITHGLGEEIMRLQKEALTKKPD
jgi:hypothetical protein